MLSATLMVVVAGVVCLGMMAMAVYSKRQIIKIFVLLGAVVCIIAIGAGMKERGRDEFKNQLASSVNKYNVYAKGITESTGKVVIRHLDGKLITVMVSKETFKTTVRPQEP